MLVCIAWMEGELDSRCADYVRDIGVGVGVGVGAL